jgi:hypothetical protein
MRDAHNTQVHFIDALQARLAKPHVLDAVKG